ncbi:MAG: thioredoxin family protein [Oscillatoriales cyanobacterium RM1_1_9]|nr:thioredoxin family protein [Oscillatoriales cyanobacterium SM2_3_0]NJO44972.1 thioredoxin family protein [Oscillatoriales cyanobacterium RM2_1_1]NJO72194.1 thioredoxin family protein [Oscillatoriales cyanobacterium RM1_1_9]
MALTTSTMLRLGTTMPNFNLPDVISGKIISSEIFSHQKAFLVMFICRHCPFVQHVQHELARLGQDYHRDDLAIIAISSNSVQTHPEDGSEQLKEMAVELGFNFPYCYDATQEVAQAFTAACTPDFFLFDSDRHLVYRGQLDSSRPTNGILVTGHDLRAAIDAVLVDQVVESEQQPSVGCNIKWHPGFEPKYSSR